MHAGLKGYTLYATQMAEDTNTYAGFALAKTMLDTTGRPDAKGKLVILMTDGEQNEGQPASVIADALKAEGVEIFGIGVGASISKATMNTCVSLARVWSIQYHIVRGSHEHVSLLAGHLYLLRYALYCVYAGWVSSPVTSHCYFNNLNS